MKLLGKCNRLATLTCLTCFSFSFSFLFIFDRLSINTTRMELVPYKWVEIDTSTLVYLPVRCFLWGVYIIFDDFAEPR